MTDGTRSERPDETPRVVGADRVLAILVELARLPGGASLDDLSRIARSPKPTVHRALASLRSAGLADQDSPGHYVLGDEFLRLAFAHHEARPDHVRVQPVLDALTARYGETTHYAVLDGHDVVYRAKVDPPTGGVRLTSTIGGRNAAHATGVGKALLAMTLPDDEAVREWVGDRTLDARTPATLTSADALAADLAVVRARGWAVDDEENEPGIVCIAIPVYLVSPTVPSGAISVSALRFRTPLATLEAEVPAILRDLADAHLGKDS
ncbi:IclR family transcriptional regulator [Actinotalea sp.]|uniref:IclR family transcriptional regulator n=1 Tax=Actinotalea sp. TaxID=1872145 RepID=UPI00356A3CEB